MQKSQKKKQAPPPPKNQAPRKSVKKAAAWTFFKPLLFILPVVFAAFAPILDNALTNWDDPDLIIDNPLIRDFSIEGIKKLFTTFYFGNYQPLHLLSYTIEYHFWQLNPAGYHAVSLALFLGITALVYWFILLISKHNRTIATIATLLFAINAMRVESVAWAAERKDMLYALFYLTSLISYVKYITSRKDPSDGLKIRFFIYAFLLFILSVFSKVMAVSIVGPMVFLDYYYARKLSVGLILEKIPFVAVSVAIGLAQVEATASAGTIAHSGLFTLGDRILIVCRNLMFFFYKMLLPLKLSAFHPYPLRQPGDSWPLEFYIAPVFVLLLLILVAWSFRKTRVVIFVTGFFLAAIALVLQFVAIGPSMFNERYSLIPAVALSFGLAYGIWWLTEKKPSLKYPLYGATAFYLLVMFVLTFQRCNVWQTSLTLWDDALAQYPHASMALNNRGKIYGKDLGNTTKAMEDLTMAIQYDKEFEQPYSNRGIIYCMNGKFDLAISDFDNAIRIKPGYYEALSNRGIAYAQTNRPEQALGDFTRCIEIEPGKTDSYINRGFCYMQLKQYQKALDDFNTGLQYEPGNPQFLFRRAQALFNLQRYKEAWQDVEAVRATGMKIDHNFYKLAKKMATGGS